jgi:hypothetical protein
VVARRFWFDERGRLVDEPPTTEGADRYLDDPSAGEQAYSSELLDDLNRFTQPQVPIHWTAFDDDHRVAYQTDPLPDPVTIAGSGHVLAWIRPGTTDTAVQVTVTEIRPDGLELRVQSGWHRLAHRAEDPARSDDLAVDYTYTPEDRSELTVGEWMTARIPIYPVTHVFRAGSSIRVSVSTPGRDHPFWCFDNPTVAGAGHDVGRGGDRASCLVLPVWPVGVGHPADHPPAGSLRGQPMRPASSIHNRAG